MTEPLLEIRAKCRGNDPCLFEGREMFLDITITNRQKTEVGVPLEYLQKAGPLVKLTDNRTKAQTHLKGNLADPELRSRLTRLSPGETAQIEWVITAEELQRFGRYVDVTAEITIRAHVEAGGKAVEFSGATSLHIVGRKEQ